MQRHPELQKLCRGRADITPSYLERLCKRSCPGWRIGQQREKKAFTAPQKRTRLRYAVNAVDQPMDYWLSTVFCDEHVCYRRPYLLKGIHLGRRRFINHDKRLRRYPWAYPKLHFLYGVHWKLGVLGPYLSLIHI